MLVRLFVWFLYSFEKSLLMLSKQHSNSSRRTVCLDSKWNSISRVCFFFFFCQTTVVSQRATPKKCSKVCVCQCWCIQSSIIYSLWHLCIFILNFSRCNAGCVCVCVRFCLIVNIFAMDSLSVSVICLPPYDSCCLLCSVCQCCCCYCYSCKFSACNLSSSQVFEIIFFCCHRFVSLFFSSFVLIVEHIENCCCCCCY